MRKIFNYLSVISIGVGVLICLLFLGSNFALKFSSSIMALIYGVVCGTLFWVLGYIVDKVFIYIKNKPD